MKIISITELLEHVVIQTDNKDRPNFVYKKDKFNSKEQMIAEIKKSITLEAKKKHIKEIKVNSIMEK